MHSILLVDDEPEILAAWHLILVNEGYEVRCARNGVEALHTLKLGTPDVIITDWVMPLMDGAELCRRLKAARPRACTDSRPLGSSASAGQDAGIEYLLAEARRCTTLSHNGRTALQANQIVRRTDAGSSLLRRGGPVPGLPG